MYKPVDYWFRQTAPISRTFLALTRFLAYLKKTLSTESAARNVSPYPGFCMNLVRTLLSLCGISVGYNYEPRPNSRVLATADTVITISLSIKGY